MNTTTMHLVQLQHQLERRIALVKEPNLLLIDKYKSVYDLALAAIESATSITDIVNKHLTAGAIDYNEVYNGKSEWRLLPAFDHPENPLSCMVSGTGLTHKNSALNRQLMHQNSDEKPTDSIRMYQSGLAGGSPRAGEIGSQPEWFYKGTGVSLKGHGDFLEVPAYANDGGEEPEIAGLYVVGKDGTPYRIGFCTGNEFSDHVMEKQNYLYLAPSKLRQCAIGPELVIDADFIGFSGMVTVKRGNNVLWESPVNSGESNMAHTLSNLEYHHFKYEGHCVPLQAHVHFFGADAFSFGNKIQLQDGDEMSIEWQGMGRPLKNYIKVVKEKEKLKEIKTI